MRLDRFLANSGVGTRKEVKDLLKKRGIKVNGVTVTDGSTRIDENSDAVEYKEKKIEYKPFIYIMMNKPKGVISATEDERHRTVLDLLENKYRTYSLFPVGRLDIDTEGLLLLTNDGMLAHNLLSPNKHIDKKYYVELKNPLSEKDVKELEAGMELESGFITKEAKVEIIENADIPLNRTTGEKKASKTYITIKEGKYHQVKRMFKAVGNKVEYLKRIKMGKLELDNKLGLGQYRELTEEELKGLKK